MLLVALAPGALAACTVPSHQEPGSATASVGEALSSASSATATAQLTVELLDAGDLTTPVADAALRDQITVLQDASLTLTTLVPPDDTSSGQRTVGLDAVAAATGQVVAARAWVARQAGGDLTQSGSVPSTGADVLDALDEVTQDLDAALALAGGA